MKKYTLVELIDRFDGQILANDFKSINEEMPLKEQLTLLDEDMLLIKLTKKNLAIDIGWYSRFRDGDSYEEYKSRGEFILHVAQNSNWQDPLLTLRSRTLTGLKKAIKRAYLFIDSY